MGVAEDFKSGKISLQEAAKQVSNKPVSPVAPAPVSISMPVGSSSYGGGVVAPGYTVQNGRVVPISSNQGTGSNQIILSIGSGGGSGGGGGGGISVSNVPAPYAPTPQGVAAYQAAQQPVKPKVVQPTISRVSSTGQTVQRGTTSTIEAYQPKEKNLIEQGIGVVESVFGSLDTTKRVQNYEVTYKDPRSGRNVYISVPAEKDETVGARWERIKASIPEGATIKQVDAGVVAPDIVFTAAETGATTLITAGVGTAAAPVVRAAGVAVKPIFSPLGSMVSKAGANIAADIGGSFVGQTGGKVVQAVAPKVAATIARASQTGVGKVVSSGVGKVTGKGAREFVGSQIVSQGFYLGGQAAPEASIGFYSALNQENVKKAGIEEIVKDEALNKELSQKGINAVQVENFGGQVNYTDEFGNVVRSEQKKGRLSFEKDWGSGVVGYIQQGLPGTQLLDAENFKLFKERVLKEMDSNPKTKFLSQEKKEAYAEYLLNTRFVGGRVGGQIGQLATEIGSEVGATGLYRVGLGKISAGGKSRAGLVWGMGALSLPYGAQEGYYGGEVQAKMNLRETTMAEKGLNVLTGAASSATFNLALGLTQPLPSVQKRAGLKGTADKIIEKGTQSGILQKGVETVGNVLDLAEKPGDILAVPFKGRGVVLTVGTSTKLTTEERQQIKELKKKMGTSVGSIGGYQLTESEQALMNKALAEQASKEQQKQSQKTDIKISTGVPTIIEAPGTTDTTTDNKLPGEVPPIPDDTPPVPDDTKQDTQQDIDTTTQTGTQTTSNVPITVMTPVGGGFPPMFPPLGEGQGLTRRGKLYYVNEVGAASLAMRQGLGLPTGKKEVAKYQNIVRRTDLFSGKVAKQKKARK